MRQRFMKLGPVGGPRPLSIDTPSEKLKRATEFRPRLSWRVRRSGTKSLIPQALGLYKSARESARSAYACLTAPCPSLRGVDELFGHVAAGRISIEINQRYALQDAVQAHRDLEARKTTGSSVFVI